MKEGDSDPESLVYIYRVEGDKVGVWVIDR